MIVTLAYDSLEAARAQLLGFGAEALELAELCASSAAQAADVAAFYAERAGKKVGMIPLWLDGWWMGHATA